MYEKILSTTADCDGSVYDKRINSTAFDTHKKKPNITLFMTRH